MEPHSEVKPGVPREDLDVKLFKNASSIYLKNSWYVCVPPAVQELNGGRSADVPVHLTVRVAGVTRRTSEHFSGDWQMGSYFALVSHESLLLFTFFHFEVHMIENSYSK